MAKNSPGNVVAKFFVACLGANAWAVGVANRRIPGAVLQTREAAIQYASELAAAAGVHRVHLDIVGARQAGRCAPAMPDGVIHA